MKSFRQYISEQRVDKHEMSGHVVIDGHVFRDHSGGSKTRLNYSMVSIPPKIQTMLRILKRLECIEIIGNLRQFHSLH